MLRAHHWCPTNAGSCSWYSWGLWAVVTWCPLLADIWTCSWLEHLLTGLPTTSTLTPFPNWIATTASISNLKHKKHHLSSTQTLPGMAWAGPGPAKGALTTLRLGSVLVAQMVKNLPAMEETPDSIPGSGRSPGEGNGYLLQYSWRRPQQPTLVFLPGRSRGQRSLVGCSPWGREE